MPKQFDKVAVLTFGYDVKAKQFDARSDFNDHLRFDMNNEQVTKLFDELWSVVEKHAAITQHR